MSSRSPRGRAVALAAAAPLLSLAVATPAGAASPDSFSSRTSGGSATASWTEFDRGDLLGLPGNTHVGFLSVYKQPGWLKASGLVFDYECDPGESPDTGGHGGPGSCDWVLDEFGNPTQPRFLSNSGNLEFTATASSARLTGNLVVANSGGDHGEPGTPVGRPTVDMTWTSTGGNSTFRRTETYSTDSATYKTTMRGGGYQASVGGRIGAMGFTDDSDDVSAGSAEHWKQTSRQRLG